MCVQAASGSYFNRGLGRGDTRSDRQQLNCAGGGQSNGIVVLVDAETVGAAFEDIYIGDAVQRQPAEADLLIVNKLDLIECAEQIFLEDWLTQKAPLARQVPAKHAKVPLDAVLGGGGCANGTQM